MDNMGNKMLTLKIWGMCDQQLQDLMKVGNVLEGKNCLWWIVLIIIMLGIGDGK